MSTIERSVEVGVPARIAYDQWTQFEEFPQFMEGVTDVRQLDDRTLAWTAEIAGRTERWTAEITEQTPDKRIAWRSTSGTRHAGVVTFHRLTDDSCRVMLQMAWEPEGLVETVGDLIGITAGRVAGDLHRFKDFIEARGIATGAWRGTIEARAS